MGASLGRAIETRARVPARANSDRCPLSLSTSKIAMTVGRVETASSACGSEPTDLEIAEGACCLAAGAATLEGRSLVLDTGCYWEAVVDSRFEDTDLVDTEAFVGCPIPILPCSGGFYNRGLGAETNGVLYSCPELPLVYD